MDPLFIVFDIKSYPERGALRMPHGLNIDIEVEMPNDLPPSGDPDRTLTNPQ
jgi:hypothetical protein